MSPCKRGPLTRQVPWLALVQIHHSNHTRLQGATANFALQIVCNELLIGGMESKSRRHSRHGLSSWSVNNSCRAGGGGVKSKTSLLSACKERRRRRNHALKPRLGKDNKPIHDLSFPQLPQVATSEKHHHQNIKRSKQRTRHYSIPLYLTTSFCSLVGPPPPPTPLLCLCVSESLSLHTTDFYQTVFRTHFRHTSNHLLLRPLPPEALAD
jgi:hypothetical protein